MMKKAGCTTLSADCAVGFNKDLLDKISQDLGFTYTLKEVDDKKYGIKSGEKWSGMIGEVVDKVRYEYSVCARVRTAVRRVRKYCGAFALFGLFVWWVCLFGGFVCLVGLFGFCFV